MSNHKPNINGPKIVQPQATIFKDRVDTLNEYELAAMRYRMYPGLGSNVVYPILALGGECGELQNVLKKILRVGRSKPNNVERAFMLLELGDILWYTNAVALELNSGLSEIAQLNVNKIIKRSQDNSISQIESKKDD